MTELASRGLIDGRQLGDEDGVSVRFRPRSLAAYSAISALRPAIRRLSIIEPPAAASAVPAYCRA